MELTLKGLDYVRKTIADDHFIEWWFDLNNDINKINHKP